jgi:dTDP-4-amino-4,6-dideoxygalactose transaminase
MTQKMRINIPKEMSYKIPLFDLNFDEKEEQAILEVIRSKWISTGPKCQEFEELFSTMLQVNYAVSLASCTSALHLSCIILGIKENDEVICPSLTFAATVNCIRYVRAIPVFSDIKGPDHLNMDPHHIEKLITPKTKAIMVMHYAGFPADMDAIMSIAKKYNLKVIEDACHGPLSEYKGKKLGTIGDVGCFSFFSNKNISTGEGGMLVTNNEVLATRVKSLRSHGMTTMSYQRFKGHATAYDIPEIGYNYRLDDIRAAIGIVQLRKLKEDLIKRSIIRSWYIDALKHIDSLIIPFSDNKEFVSNYIMPIVLKDSTTEKRDHIRDELFRKGIQTSLHYPAVHQFSFYKQYNITLPKTEYVTHNEITLPMYSSLTERDVHFIVKSLQIFL